MHNLHFVPRFSQPAVHVFCDHHGTMLSSGATEADGQIALALANVMRQQVDQQFRDAVDELLSLRERAYIFRDPRIPSCERAKLRNEVRIGEKTHIEYQVSIVGQSVLVSKTHTGYEDCLLAAGVLLKAVRQMRPQFMHIKFGSVDYQIGDCPNRPQMPPLRSQ